MPRGMRVASHGYADVSTSTVSPWVLVVAGISISLAAGALDRSLSFLLIVLGSTVWMAGTLRQLKLGFALLRLRRRDYRDNY